MDQNGQSDSGFMALDTLTATGSASRDVLDEPTAPRRNSTDDHDTSRPRKRPAVMLGQDDRPESTAGNTQFRSEKESLDTQTDDAEVVQEIISRQADGAEANKTIELRAPMTPDATTSQITIAEPDATENNRKSNSPSYSPGPHMERRPSIDSESQSLARSSPEIEVEEVAAMHANDHFTNQIHVLNPSPSAAASFASTRDPRKLMESIGYSFERDPSPLAEICQLTDAISTMMNIGNSPNSFDKHYFEQEALWCHLPAVVDMLLKREELFRDDFYNTKRGTNGAGCIARLLHNFICMTALLARHDITLLQTLPAEQEVVLHSRLYLHTVLAIFQPASLYQVIDHSGYPISKYMLHIVHSFKEPQGLLRTLAQLLPLVFSRIPSQHKLLQFSTASIAIISGFLRALEQNTNESSSNDVEINCLIGEVFILAESTLKDMLELHGQTVEVKEFLQFLDQLGQLAQTLHAWSCVSGPLEARLEEKAGVQLSVLSLQETSPLAEFSFRLPLYYKMVSSGRMDFRLRGLNRMGECFIKAYKVHHNRNWREVALLRYMVDFLLKNKVVQYLLGPDSHLELIRRSASIVGFLVVTDTITEDLLDSLWQPVVDNKDPRIVQATLAMHRDMMPSMGTDMFVQLCAKVTRLPLSVFDHTLVDFVSTLLEYLRGAPKRLAIQELHCLNVAPYNMLIRILRMASQQEADQTASCGLAASHLFEFAANELMTLAEYGPANDVRRDIFEECVKDFREGIADANGSATVVYAFLKHRPRHRKLGAPTVMDDLSYLVNESQFSALMVSELVAFIDSHRNSNQLLRQRRLKSRLELLHFILELVPDCLTDNLRRQLWSYLVGDRALGSYERDQGFEFYLTFDLPSSGIHPLLDSAYREYFPALDPADFSPMVLNFCKRSLEYLNQPNFTKGQDMQINPDIPFEGIEQLWRILFCSTDDSLARDAANYMVSFVLDSPTINMLPLQTAETVHIRIVERCIGRLTSCSQTLSGAINEIDQIEKALDDSVGQCSKAYHRSIRLLDQLVKEHKLRPRFNLGNNIDSLQAFQLRGDRVLLKFRWHADHYQSPIQSLEAGTLNSGQELHSCISRTVGGTRFRAFLAGRELKLLEDPLKSLSKLGFTSGCFLLIQKAPKNPLLDSVEDGITTESSSDGLEPVIMQHFEALYSLLALPAPLSSKAWEFLVNFAPHERVKNELVSPSASLDLLPVNNPYKLLYSLYALDYCFEEQHDARTEFVQASLTRVLKCLIGTAIETPPQSAEIRLLISSRLTKCLRSFLKEPIPISFPDANKYLESLHAILSLCAHPKYRTRPGVACCISNAIDVLFESCKICPDIWIHMSATSGFRDLIQEFLVTDERAKVRQCVGDAIKAISTSDPRNSAMKAHDFAEFFWLELNRTLATDYVSLDPERSDHLFSTLLILFQYLSQTESTSLNVRELFAAWFARLSRQPFTERVGRCKENHIVMGYARLMKLCLVRARALGVTIQAESTDVDHLWRHLLFPPYTQKSGNRLEELVPCLHDDSRNELYNLLLELARESKLCSRITKLCLRLFPKEDTIVDGYHNDRKRWLRAQAGCVGLHNLSNTCYLNSLVTQLFMNTSFRDFILKLPVYRPDQTAYQLKALFAHLQEGFCKAVEPRDFVESLHDFAGQPIDPTVQMDVDEFYNLVFDRIESELPSADMKSTFKSYYGGQLVQQVKSYECGHISELMEPFSAIQCDIKGKTDLQESLRAYVEGEVMEGDNKYRCNSCDRLVNAVKRTCVKILPNHLILHLKRFDFDLQTLHRSKINDFFNFPTSLDMKPYTLDYLSAQENKRDPPSDPDVYELVGVLVHTGTAESGHYYSYIRDCESSGASWVEYNDSDVSSFDPNTIPGACFGGCDGVSGSGYSINKAFSAYMLFYQRASSREDKGDAPGVQLNEKPHIPPALRWEVLQENERLLRKYCMFDNNFLGFITGLVNGQIEHDRRANSVDMRKALSLTTKAFEHIATRYKECARLDPLIAAMRTCTEVNEECCREFLLWAAKKETITNVLVYNPYMRARQAFSTITLDALKHLRNINPTAYGLPDKTNEPGTQGLSMLSKICHGFVQAWAGLQWMLKPWNDFFGTLVTLAHMGDTEKEAMLQAGVLTKIFEMLLIEHLPLSKRHTLDFDNFPKLWSKPKVPASKLADLLSALLEICSPFVEPCATEDDRQASRYHLWLPLTAFERDCLFYSPRDSGLGVFTKLLDLAPGPTEAVAKITVNLLSADITPAEDVFLEKIKNTLLTGVPVEPAAQAWPYLQCLYEFVSVTRSPNYVSDIIRKVAEEVLTIGNSGGMEHLWFFRKIVGETADWGCSAIEDIIETVSIWAPPLLVYYDASVRNATEEVVKTLLFEPYETFPSDERRDTLLEFTNGCFDFVQYKFSRSRQYCDEGTFENILRLLQKLVIVQANEEQFESRMEGLKNFIDRLILEDEEDADIASDDWACSEVGSETHEVVAPLDDYSA